MNAEEIKKIISGFEKKKVEKAAPCHSPGDLARQMFERYYRDGFLLIGAGKRIKIVDAGTRR